MHLPRELARLLNEQAGVVARRQAFACGLVKSDIDRLVRRREWVRILPGVYVDHTGRPTWLQRAWAGALHYGPTAALAGASALRLTAGPGWRAHDDQGPVWVAVEAGRNVTVQPGYRIRYLVNYHDQVQSLRHPPCMRFEEACLDVVLATTPELDRIQMLADACQSGRTTAKRLLSALAGRSRVRERRWLEAVLHDIADGTCSALEHGYLTKVERPHNLPRARRQRSAKGSQGTIYRDVVYEQFDQPFELDGRLFHNSSAARDADLERDLDAALTNQHTVRLGWGQVYGRPCGTAVKVGLILVSRGWTGSVRPCGPGCEAA